MININIEKSRVAIITGASQGIGKTTALFFANKGWNVWVTTRDPSKVNFKNCKIRVVKLDLQNSENVRKVVMEILNQEGRIDLLINNASYVMISPCESSTIEKIQELFNVNVFAPMRMVTAVLPIMRQQQFGHIVNIGSTSGLQAVPGLGIFAATKFALEGYSQALAVEVRQWNIKVHILEIGTVKTPWLHNCEISREQVVPEYYALVDSLSKRLEMRTLKAQECDSVAEAIFNTVHEGSSPFRLGIGCTIEDFFLDPSGEKYLLQQQFFLKSLLQD